MKQTNLRAKLAGAATGALAVVTLPGIAHAQCPTLTPEIVANQCGVLSSGFDGPSLKSDGPIYQRCVARLQASVKRICDFDANVQREIGKSSQADGELRTQNEELAIFLMNTHRGETVSLSRAVPQAGADFLLGDVTRARRAFERTVSTNGLGIRASVNHSRETGLTNYDALKLYQGKMKLYGAVISSKLNTNEPVDTVEQQQRIAGQRREAAAFATAVDFFNGISASRGAERDVGYGYNVREAGQNNAVVLQLLTQAARETCDALGIDVQLKGGETTLKYNSRTKVMTLPADITVPDGQNDAIRLSATYAFIKAGALLSRNPNAKSFEEIVIATSNRFNYTAGLLFGLDYNGAFKALQPLIMPRLQDMTTVPAIKAATVAPVTGTKTQATSPAAKPVVTKPQPKP